MLGFLDPDTTTIDLSVLPTERNATFQVRPFQRGAASPVIHETSAPETS